MLQSIIIVMSNCEIHYQGYETEVKAFYLGKGEGVLKNMTIYEKLMYFNLWILLFVINNNFNSILKTIWQIVIWQYCIIYVFYFRKSAFHLTCLISCALYACRKKLYAFSVHYKCNCEYYQILSVKYQQVFYYQNFTIFGPWI